MSNIYLHYKEDFKEYVQTAQNIEDLSDIESSLERFSVDSSSLLDLINDIVEGIFNNKAVYTALVTLLFYKIYNPDQDIRLHQKKMENGFSARGFDTKVVTPILKEFGIPSMSETAWSTKVLEKTGAYSLDNTANFQNQHIKYAFLHILNFVQSNTVSVDNVLKVLIKKGLEKSKENQVDIIRLDNPNELTIKEVIHILNRQFSHDYGEPGGAKLPVIAFHAIYQILILELKKYECCALEPLGSHTASDRTSSKSGDIEIIYTPTGELLESLEIKLDIPIDANRVLNAKNKILIYQPKQYYILSTSSVIRDKEYIDRIIDEVREIQGCQIIINGVIHTLNYYLRLISNIKDFIDNYSYLISIDNELRPSHKLYWNQLLEALDSKNK